MMRLLAEIEHIRGKTFRGYTQSEEEEEEKITSEALGERQNQRYRFWSHSFNKCFLMRNLNIKQLIVAVISAMMKPREHLTRGITAILEDQGMQK